MAWWCCGLVSVVCLGWRRTSNGRGVGVTVAGSGVGARDVSSIRIETPWNTSTCISRYRRVVVSLRFSPRTSFIVWVVMVSTFLRLIPQTMSGLVPMLHLCRGPCGVEQGGDQHGSAVDPNSWAVLGRRCCLPATGMSRQSSDALWRSCLAYGAVVPTLFVGSTRY